MNTCVERHRTDMECGRPSAHLQRGHGLQICQAPRDEAQLIALDALQRVRCRFQRLAPLRRLQRLPRPMAKSQKLRKPTVQSETLLAAH